MEKSFEEVLVQFYVDQYRENAKRSTGKPVKLAHYIHRLNNKAKSIKYARFSKNETIALDKHRKAVGRGQKIVKPVAAEQDRKVVR